MQASPTGDSPQPFGTGWGMSVFGFATGARLGDLPGGSELLVAGVGRATNTPPMRDGGRTVFVSLDDVTGAVSNLVFFHDAQDEIGAPVFRAKYMLVRGRTDAPAPMASP